MECSSTVDRVESARPVMDCSLAGPMTSSPATSVELTPGRPAETRTGAIRSIWEKNCDGLDVEQREQLWQVLWDFENIFALSENEVGLTHLVEHHIDTGDARPVKVRPRRLPLAQQEAADQEIRAMLEAGIIEPSDSPWASGVVMVPRKKSTRPRFCVDYRPLNKVTKKDCYPLPRIDETLDLVSGSAWFSSLDLRSGYWQVPITTESRPKTAFCTTRGHWQSEKETN